MFIRERNVYAFTGYVLPEGYVELKYVSSRVDDIYDLYINDQLIAEGITSFSTDVDIVEVRYYGGSSEASLDIDDIELIDGDAAAPEWVFVEPSADTVEARSRLRADIVFDSEGLEPGVYQAEITVITNDPFNPSAVIPVKMTVRGDRRPPAHRSTCVSCCCERRNRPDHCAPERRRRAGPERAARHHRGGNSRFVVILGEP